MLIEQNKKKRFLLQLLTIAGSMLALYLAYHLYRYGVTPYVARHNIAYAYPFPITNLLSNVICALYVLITVGAFFVSSVPSVWIIGLLLFGSYWLSYYFYYHALGSVWCFCAALLSACSYIVILQGRRKK